MNPKDSGLSPQEVVRLRELVQSLLEGESLSEPQRQTLTQWLESKPAARREYCELLMVHSMLSDFFPALIEEPSSSSMSPVESASDIPQPKINASSSTTLPLPLGATDALPGWGFGGLSSRSALWMWGTVGTVLSLALIVVLVRAGWLDLKPGNRGSVEVAGSNQPSPAVVDSYLSGVARIVQMEDAVWETSSDSLKVGCWLPPVRMKLVSGKVCLAFDRGAELTLAGPADIELISNSQAMLHSGSASAFVPPMATGFVVDTPSAKITDIGTRFSLNVADKDSKVVVLEGQVEVRLPQEKGRFQNLLEKEAVLIDGTSLQSIDWESSQEQLGISPFKPVSQSEKVAFFHWSFDQSEKDTVSQKSYWPETGWHPKSRNHHAVCRSRFDDGGPATRPSQVPGLFGSAIRLDGKGAVLDTELPGIGQDKARTVCFWVRVPPATKKINAYSVIAWGNWRNDGGKWQIGWNPNLESYLGNLGALRTEVSNGFVIGETDLRDDQWHHVASVYLGGSYSDIRAKFRLYVDGRLENFSGYRTMPVQTDIENSSKVSIGEYIGNLQTQQTFLGEIDELYLFEGALTPAQIEHLMKQNQPPLPTEIIPTTYYTQ